MLPLNFTTNCYAKRYGKVFGEEPTDYSCKNQIFTKSVEGITIEWKKSLQDVLFVVMTIVGIYLIPIALG